MLHAEKEFIMEDIISYGYKYDLVYSPDEGAYYWQKFPECVTSQFFSSKKEAKKALVENKVKWG